MKAIGPERFFIVGNNMALDFVNSIMKDLTIEDLAAWTVAVGLANSDKAKTIAAAWSGQSLKAVLEFRDRLRDAVSNIADGVVLSNGTVDAINTVLRQGTGGFSILKRKEGGFVRDYEIDLSKPTNILHPIAESFVDLLCYGNLELLRKCENPKCVLYFYDTTKSHRRRWCSMAVCGNQAKAKKFYEKSRKASAA
jgi:predicted RNA-binding Zn ribbon-like protein